MTQLMSPSMVAESFDSAESFQFNIRPISWSTDSSLQYFPKSISTPGKNETYLSLIGGTGETPRRSARISEKAKATPPEKEHPKKRGQKSSGSKKDETGTVTEENESGNEVQMQDAEGTEKGKADKENYGTKENRTRKKMRN
ncbi:methyl-CpG-binding domain-containing protein 11-like [Populus alba x Populus x berolinensis]|uniref:Methyl-CpG-binding domain-containing protein 11-like n=1 Tax=Populus alba x Populus x berolinensis TaxID=444605 RepID=A0AAD6W8R9_9ROSI|nr:methyl-CpG-binding domain-containing protein 11-like [Populus alba x Populus x berolinensis]